MLSLVFELIHGESAAMAPIAFEIDAQKRIVTWRTGGSITQDEVDKMRREIDLQAKFKEG